MKMPGCLEYDEAGLEKHLPDMHSVTPSPRLKSQILSSPSPSEVIQDILS